MCSELEKVKDGLKSLPPSIFASAMIMERVPYVFKDNFKNYIDWKHDLAKGLNIDPNDIIISGSACLGVSLNPNKNFKLFDERSDIDVCIISEYYFNVAWHELRDIELNKLSGAMKSSIMDHRNRLIYWGTIATDKILPLLSFGKEWENYIKQMKEIAEIKNHEVKFRIYKDSRSFRDYILISIRDRQMALIGG